MTLGPRWPAGSPDLAEWTAVGALSAWWTPIQPQTSYTIERDPCVSVIAETLTRFTDGLSCQWCSCFPMDVMYQPPLHSRHPPSCAESLSPPLEAKRQYLLTLQVSRYRLLALRGCTDPCWKFELPTVPLSNG